MNKKNLATVVGAGGLMAVAFVAGGLLVKDGAARPVVIAGGKTPTVTSTAAPEVTLTPEVVVVVEPIPGGGETSGSGASDGSSSNSGGGSAGGSSGGTMTGSSGSGTSGNGGGMPQPEPQPQPQPEDPDPVLEPDPEPEPPVEPQPEPQPQNPAPFLMQIVPTHNVKGVAVNSNIVVKFSEAMHKPSTEAALIVQGGMAGVFTWNAEGTQMTFNPAVDFAYNDMVHVTLATSAKDAGGKNLEHESNLFFYTLKRTTVQIQSQAAYDGTVYNPSAGIQVLGSKVIGNQASIKAGTWQRGFLSFDLSGLPDDLKEIESAKVKVYQHATDPGAYGGQTGKLLLQSVVYGSLDISDFNKAVNQFCFPGCVNLQQTLSISALAGWKTADMTTPVIADWNLRAERGERSQFRMVFENENDGDGPQVTSSFYASESNTEPVLEVTYLHP